MKLSIAALSLLTLASQSRAHEVIVPTEQVSASDAGGHFEIPDRRRERKSLRASDRHHHSRHNQDRLMEAATLMPTCSYSRTHSDSIHSRGFYFTAPTDFCIVGLSVPNEMNEQLQNVEVIIRDTLPPEWPASARGGSVFHAAAMDVNEVIATKIQVRYGKVVGLLGTAGSGTMRNSYCAEDTFITTIDGMTVPLGRFLAQDNIAHGPARDYLRETDNISRVNMFYIPGECGKDTSPVTSSPVEAPTLAPALSAPSTTPSSRWSLGPTFDESWGTTCGNCNEGRGEMGCSCSKCEGLVCEVDEYCCTDFWDRKCVDLAESLCDCPIPSPVPSGAPSASTNWPSNMPSMESSTSQEPSTSPSTTPLPTRKLR